VANVPLPGPKLIRAVHLPAAAREILETLRSAGHAGYVVGGSLRDVMLGRDPHDWDFTTDARPERIQELFPGAIYENRFGTVTVRREGAEYQVTTFRSDHEYADHRRPHRIEFGDSIRGDLARRDFTVNAMAWGFSRARAAGETAGTTVGGTAETAAGAAFGTTPGRSRLVDPFGGRADIASRTLRAVGNAEHRFEEDSLRMIRAVRLAATLGFQVDPETLGAIRAKSHLAGHLSGERVATELERLLQAPRPSVGLRLMEETGLLRVVMPELADQRGIAQNKIEGEDLWDHTLRAVDAAPRGRPIVRLAALLHDVGKPPTLAEGHFHEHEKVGAGIAARILARLRVARATQERVVHLVRHHMFSYEPGWSDAAVRRFMGRIGTHGLEELFMLHEADNVGSGLPAEDDDLRELRGRVAAQLEANVPLTRADLAIDGDDLIAEFGLDSGPSLGRILDSLLDQVIADSGLNDRATLMLLAQSMLPEER